MRITIDVDEAGLPRIVAQPDIQPAAQRGSGPISAVSAGQPPDALYAALGAAPPTAGPVPDAGKLPESQRTAAGAIDAGGPPAWLVDALDKNGS